VVTFLERLRFEIFGRSGLRVLPCTWDTMKSYDADGKVVTPDVSIRYCIVQN